MKLSFSVPRVFPASCAALLILRAVSAQADYQATVLNQGPVGYWRLNETTAPLPPPILATNIGSVGAAGNGTYIDAQRGHIPGALAGDPSNAAVSFGGVIESNRVRIPFQPQWNPSGPFTVEFWAKPAQTATLACPAASVEFIVSPLQRNGWLFYQGSPDLSDGNGWVFREYNSQGLTNLSTASVSMALDTNKWYHVVGVFDGTQISTYVNGALGATTPFAGTPRANTNSLIPLTFGARADGVSGYFTYGGEIDEAAVYDVALSPARILAHYQAGTNASPPTPYNQLVLADNPAGYWRFNEPTDPVAGNLGTLGIAGNGSYIYHAMPGAAGPRPPTYPGFEPANNAVSFDGVSGGYVTVPALNLNTNTVTITGWIKASGAQPAGMGLILNRSGQTTAGITIDIAPGGGLGLSYNWAGDPATFNFDSLLSLADSDWSYVALVVQPTQAALFTASAANAGSWASATNFATHISQPFEGPTLFGADLQPTTNLFLNGSIDEVAIFNRALSAGELFTAYSAAVGGVAPQLFADVTAPVNPPFTGDALNLTVDAGGTPTLSFQWRKNGVGIASANTSSFTIDSLKSTDSGSYDVVITNSFGTVTSSAAIIAVQTPTQPTIVQGPVGRTLYPGGQLDLNVQATGGELQYQWQRGGTNLTGATNSTYIVNSVTTADAGQYQVNISNPAGSTSAGPVTVTVISPAPNSYEATIVADSPEAWWRLDEPVGSSTMYDAMGRHDGTYVGSGITLGAPGAVANGATNTAASFDGTSFAAVPYSADLNSTEYTIEAWAFVTDVSVIRAPVSTYDTTSHKGVFFTSNPDSTWQTDGGINDAVLYYYIPMGALTLGHWSHLAVTFSVADGTISYLNGQAAPGQYADFVRNGKFDFLIGAVGTNWQGIAPWEGSIDEVAVYKHALTAQQIQNHYVQALYGNATKPQFVTQPQSITLSKGDLASLSAQVEGSIPITYQWFKDGVRIPSATNDTLVFVSTKFGDTGAYELVATNPAGTNTSNVANLVVLPPVTFANATNGLVLHLKFDGDYTDASGRGNNGTPIGTPTFVTGQIGKALHYSTSTDTGGSLGTVTNADYVTLGRPPDLLFGASSSFSVAFWVRLPNGYTNGDLPFFSSAVGSANSPGFTFCPSYQRGGWQWCLDQVVGNVTNNIDVNGPDGSINDGIWHHFAATFDRDSTLAQTYLDGAPVNTTSIASIGAFDTTNTMSIGQGPTGTYNESGSADLDDLGVWRRVLSPLEVYEIYYSGANFGAAFDAYGPVSLAITSSGQNSVLIWQAGTLYQANTLAGPWSAVSGAQAPTYTVTPAAGAKFYRVKL